MDVQFLEDIGMTNVQAKAYIALIETGAQTAPSLATRISESRTNGYKVLDKLCEIGLAVREQSQGKFKYAAASPAALEQYVQQQAETVRQKERRLSAELPKLLDFYFAHSERPSIRYFEGTDGIVAIYKDQINTNDTLYYVRTLADLSYLGFEQLHHLRNLFPRFGVHRQVIIQDSQSADIPEKDRLPVEESDKAMLIDRRTWIHENDYTAPVEWAAYGDKLSIVQYGDEAMGMVVESAPIAEAFRQLFCLLDEGLRRRPEYRQMPLYATYTATPELLKKDQRNI